MWTVRMVANYDAQLRKCYSNHLAEIDDIPFKYIIESGLCRPSANFEKLNYLIIIELKVE